MCSVTTSLNVALTFKQVWAIENEKERLWVCWINEYYLKGESFCSVSKKAGCSFVWSSLLMVRDEMLRRMSIDDLQHYEVSHGYKALLVLKPVCSEWKVIWNKDVRP